MTIQYSDQFFKLLLRWKGSLWKTIWKDLSVFLLIYYIINLVYRFVLNDQQRAKFEMLIILLKDYISQIPLTFLLGFYVGMVVQRWWNQFSLLSWPDQFLYCVSAHIKGKNDEARVIRRSIARYCMLAAVLAWRSVSIRVLNRFPTDNHLLEYGLITEDEYEMLKDVHVHFDPHKDWFIPLNWVQTILVRCLEEKRLTHTVELKFLLDELYRYRQGFSHLFLYQWVNIPLVYTQVATIAVYGYFGLCLIGRQYPFHNDRGHVVDMYIPVVTILQFVFYVGWLKVGEDLINPLGADDEDFELNYLLDRNLEMSYLIVDDIHMQMPRLHTYSLQEDPDAIPHTIASMKVRGYAPKPKLSRKIFKPKEIKVVIPPEIEAISEMFHGHFGSDVQRKMGGANVAPETVFMTDTEPTSSGGEETEYEIGEHGGVRPQMTKDDETGPSGRNGCGCYCSKLLCRCLRGKSTDTQPKASSASDDFRQRHRHRGRHHGRRRRLSRSQQVSITDHVQPLLLDVNASATGGRSKVSVASVGSVPVSANNGPSRMGIV